MAVCWDGNWELSLGLIRVFFFLLILPEASIFFSWLCSCHSSFMPSLSSSWWPSIHSDDALDTESFLWCWSCWCCVLHCYNALSKGRTVLTLHIGHLGNIDQLGKESSERREKKNTAIRLLWKVLFQNWHLFFLHFPSVFPVVFPIKSWWLLSCLDSAFQ